jgi:GNAT superfamily N-acetyltransferase
MLGLDTDGLSLAMYRPEDDAEALALERIAAQGQGYRLSFERPTFRRRAENFDRHWIVTARFGDRLVGIAAAAVKHVVLRGEALQAAFFFDHRVHPDFRGRHIGTRLARELYALTQDASMIYGYIVADNAEARRLAVSRSTHSTSGYGYLVFPTFRRRPVRETASEVGLAEAHAALLRAVPPFDFYTDPTQGGSTRGHAASFIVRRGSHVAGCSAWDNGEILAEVMTALPWKLRALRALFGLAPSALALPHVPAPGEKLRSWYLFDFFATDPELGRELLRHVNNAALERGIDYGYVIHLPSDPWLGALRKELPRAFAPIVSYRMFARFRQGGPFPAIERPYIDVRDV